MALKKRMRVLIALAVLMVGVLVLANCGSTCPNSAHCEWKSSDDNWLCGRSNCDVSQNRKITQKCYCD